jgi:hypothetical protein
VQQLLKVKLHELAAKYSNCQLQCPKPLTQRLSISLRWFSVLLQPLLRIKLSELAAKYGGGSSSKLVLHASKDEDGGSY